MVEKDYLEIGSVTPMQIFNVKLAKKNLEYGRKHKPYDLVCARLDFRDKIADSEKESERRHGFVKIEDINIDITDKELEVYGNADRFEFVEDQEDRQDRVIEGSRTQVVIGHTISYVCKIRGHKLAVFIPIADYKKEDKEDKEVKELKDTEK